MGGEDEAVLAVRLVAVSAADQVVGETWIEMPDDVDASNVESAIRQAFGTPAEPALEDHGSLGVVQVGWYFPGDRLVPFGLPAEGNSALVIPCLVAVDGSATPLFVANALRRTDFGAALGDAPVQVVDGRSEVGAERKSDPA